MNIATSKEGKFTIIDDSKVRQENNHFFLSQKFKDQYKTKAAEIQVKQLNPQINISQINNSSIQTNEKYFINDLKNCDLILSAVNHKK